MHRGQILFVVLCLVAGCNGGESVSDAGDDGDAKDGGADEVATPFRLVFRDGAEACAQFADGRSAREELLLRGRILFKPGTVSLPRDATTFSADIVTGVETGGPDPVTATPDGEGEITHEYQEPLWGWCHHYLFRQPFLSGDTPLVVQAKFSFCRRDGVSDPEELVFDSDLVGLPPQGLADRTRVEILGLLGAGEDYRTERQFFRSCSYQTLPHWRVTVKLDGSDQIVILKRQMKPLMASGPTGLTSAEVSLAGETRGVSSYFRLSYGADLHNYNERYLVVLDPAVGTVHGVHFQEQNIHESPTQVDLLGSGLDPTQPLEQRAVVSFTEEEL